MKALPAAWPAIARRAARGRVVACFDVDGTLAPIASHPDRARLSALTRRRLVRLAARPGTVVALISGRALRDVERLCPVRGAWYAGNHGLEIRGPGWRWAHPGARRRRRLLARLARQLRRALQAVPGAWVEVKGLSLSVHWRATPAARRASCRRVVERAVTPWRRAGCLRLTRGAGVWEIRPCVAWDKGRAVAWIARHASGQRRATLMWYAGDDETDEDAFRAVNRLGGITVRVGTSARASAARYRVRRPHEMNRWLQQLATIHRTSR